MQELPQALLLAQLILVVQIVRLKLLGCPHRDVAVVAAEVEVVAQLTLRATLKHTSAKLSVGQEATSALSVETIALSTIVVMLKPTSVFLFPELALINARQATIAQFTMNAIPKNSAFR